MAPRKVINLVSLIVMVSVNVFTPFSYADVENGTIVDIEQPVIEQPKAPETPEPVIPENPTIPEVQEPDAPVEQPKTEPETGTGADEKVEAPVEQPKVEPETGIGLDEKVETPAIETPETGTGLDEKVETPSIEAPETGTGADEKVEIPVEQPKTEPETGTGVEEKVEILEDKNESEVESGKNLDLALDLLQQEIDKEKQKELMAVLVDRVSYGETVFNATIEGNSGTMNDFEYKEIVVTDGSEKYTLMDRNLGATDRWNTNDNGWSSYNSNIYNNTNTPGSYGYYYQYGNNFGFEAGITPTISSTPVAVSQWTGKTSTYSSSTWISTTPWNSGATVNDTLWGGNGGTQVQRRGPCPEGWHIPSIDEWNGVLDILNVGDWSEVQTFANAIYLPPAGYHYFNTFSSYSYVGSRGFYWASSLGADNLAYGLTFSGGWRGNWSIEDIWRSYGISIRCFKNSVDEISVDIPVNITFNANGGYFSGGSSAKVATYTRDETFNYVTDTIIDFPNKEAEGDTKYMFDWWYLTGMEERWTGYISEDMTLYANYLPFEDLVISFTGGEVVIMDRNLGATESGTGCSSDTTTGACGYQYQWGNNYGFAHDGVNNSTGFLHNENISKRQASDWEGRVSTYYSNIFRTVSPWNKGATSGDNLWGGSDSSNSDEDKQGPCPEGYHVPDDGEWKALRKLNIGYDKLLLSPGGWRQASDQKVYNVGQFFGYRSSNPVGPDTAKAILIKGTYYTSIEFHTGGRSDTLSVRCFRNSTGTRVIKFVSNGGSPVPDSKTGRWWEREEKLPTPTMANKKFDAWYTTSTFEKGTQVYTRMITGDDTDEPITLYARWADGVATLEGNNTGKNEFIYNTITIGDYVVMDRDLGATMINGSGYRYQWGNNHGFDSLFPSESSSVVIPADKIPSKYSSGVWHENRPWTTEPNLWGDTSGTDIARQGPCPEGWHVPSKEQWVGVWNTWKASSDKSDLYQFDSENFAFDLNLVYNGGKWSWSSSMASRQCGVGGITYPNTASHRTSSYSTTYSKAYHTFVCSSLSTPVEQTTFGLPVRCFKNAPLYTLTLHTNGGEMSEPEVQQIQKGASKSLPTPTTGNDNYVFGGWYMNESFTGTRIYSITITGNIDLYAKWDPSYTLRYHPGIGYLSTTGEKLVEGTVKNLPTPTTGNEQYSFEGWYLNEDFTGNRVYSVTMTGDVDVYAKWDYHDYYNVKFHVRTETFEKNILGGRVLINVAPTTFPDGYIVGGWYLDQGFTQFYDITQPVTGNVDLYAKGFEYGTIVVEDPDNAANSGFIIMDRNLGAFEAGTGVNSYGYHYQWGNNYGFPNTGQIPYVSSSLIWNSGYDNKGYYQSGYNSSVYRNDGIYHTGVWGGSGDNYDNNRGLNIINTTSGNRQGPCPEGWHIPSAGEWSKLMEYWKKGYKGNASIYISTSNNLNNYSFTPSTGGRQFFDDLKLPFAGYRSSYSNTNGQGTGNNNYAYYRSSTPVYNSSAYMFYSYNNGSYFYAYSYYSYSYGQSIRCFKNEYNPVTHTVKFETNGGETIPDMAVVEGKPLKTNGDPIYLGYFFKGWYKDRELTQPYDMTAPVNENITLYAKWDNTFGTISISDPDNINSGFTIMDRNLGALESGTGVNSYGYMYQWGNNHGFSSISNEVNTTTTLAEWDSGYDNKGYYGTQFIVGYYGPYDYRSGSYMHNGLWGGALDNSGNHRGLDIMDQTVTGRQGPCPEGYHVPSIGERSQALKYWADTYGREKGVEININSGSSDLLYTLGGMGDNFQQYFLLPYAGHYEISSNSAGPYINHYKGNPSGYYRTTSPGNGVYGETLWISKSGINPNNVYNRYYGQSVRCFKNNYEIPSTYTLNFETNGGEEIENREIRKNHKLTGLPNIERENSKFEGWYLDDKFTQEYDFNELINKNLKFYAKWSCDFGYQLSDDYQSCETISVKFNANGGKFGSEDIVKINSMIETVPAFYTKYSHTENITDDGLRTTNDYGNGIGNYGNSWGNSNIRGTDRISQSTNAHIITIPGAENLTVDLYYNGESISWDWVSVWKGSHPLYTASSNYNNDGYVTTAEGANDNNNKFGGVWNGTYTVNGNTLTNMGHTTLTISGDTVTFSFKSDGSGYGNGYGYYAVIEGTGNTYYVVYSGDAFDDIQEPTREGYTFSGWYLDNGTFEHEFNPSEVTTGASINVYAKWNPNTYTIKFDTNGGIGEILDIDAIYGEEIILPNVTRDGYTFSGWKDENGKIYMDKIEENESLATENGVIVILTAQWEENKSDDSSSSSSSSGGGGRKITPASSDPISDKIKEKEHNSADEKQDEDKSADIQENQDSSIPSVDGDSQTSEGQNAGENKSSQEAPQYTNEQKEAYSFAKSNGITTTSTIEKAKMNTSLKRIEMAKMLSNYAINILGQEPDTSKGVVNFKDVTNKMDKQYDNGVTKAYQLGIMGQNMKNNEFRPNDEVTRAEFVTSLSRLLYSTPEGTNKGTKKYYEPHMAKLYNEGIITNTDPNMKEKRGNIMIMLMRSVK